VLRYLLWIIRTYVRSLSGLSEAMVPHTPRDLPIRLVRSPFVPTSMYAGQYEPLETQFLLRNLGPFSLFVNVGANLGWYSVIAGLQGKSVLAFEPDYLNAKVLKRNLKINGITDARIVVAAASNQRGEAQLFGGNTGASLIAGWAGQPKVVRTVPMVTFDSVASLEKEKVFVVIDVEGHELPVLEGMRKHLRSWNFALIMAEITADQHHPSGNNPDRTSVFELMSSLGFAAWYLEEGKGISPYQDWNEQSTSCTFVFTKGLLPS
jgi:FkbM family methyltransferase